jgi:AcrR family transcriptional regulator
MPKLIDYSVRFELIREAVVRVAARDGGRAVDLARIAAELQVSPSTLRRLLRSADVLAETGVVLVARKRQYQRFLRKRPKGVPEGSLAHVRFLLSIELPLDDEEIEWARAWAELTITGTGDCIVQLREAHDSYLDGLATKAVTMLAIPTARRELEAIRLRALLDGLTAAACAGRATAEQLEACLETHLSEICPRPSNDTPPSPVVLEPDQPGVRAVGPAQRRCGCGISRCRGT